MQGGKARNAKGEVITILQITEDNGIYCMSGGNYCGSELEPLNNGLSGYRYGVEYPTNGKKPDLPDDCIVMYWTSEVHTGSAKSGCLDWSTNSDDCYPIIKFKITDERYKPAEYEPVKITSTFEGSGQPGGMGASNHIPEASKMGEDWYDYETQRAIKLPPVGVECEAMISGDAGYDWGHVEILKHHNDTDCACYCVGKSLLKWADEFQPLGYSKLKADIERKRFVDAAKAYLPHVEDNLLKQLWHAGFRMPEDK